MTDQPTPGHRRFGGPIPLGPEVWMDDVEDDKLLDGTCDCPCHRRDDSCLNCTDDVNTCSGFQQENQWDENITLRAAPTSWCPRSSPGSSPFIGAVTPTQRLSPPLSTLSALLWMNNERL